MIVKLKVKEQDYELVLLPVEGFIISQIETMMMDLKRQFGEENVMLGESYESIIQRYRAEELTEIQRIGHLDHIASGLQQMKLLSTLKKLSKD